MAHNKNIPQGSPSGLKEDSENLTKLTGTQRPQRLCTVNKKLYSALKNDDKKKKTKKTSHESVICIHFILQMKN